MTVLTVILIALFLTIMVLVSKIQGTARVVNYAGLVRGKTQRIIKLEDAKEPQDEMIESVASFIEGLRYGSDELNLVRLDDHAFQNKMKELDEYFQKLQKEIRQVRKEGYENTEIIEKSEAFFVICDEATGLAEKYAQKKATALELLEKIVIADIIGLVCLLAYELIKAVKYAAQNKALKKKVYLDEATGLPNKNRCEEILDGEMPECTDGSVALCVFDLNNLRIINNRLGHDQGDAYIRSFAVQLRKALPEEYFAGRDGGDEFIAVLQCVNHEKVREILEKIRLEIAEYSKEHPEMTISYAAGYALAEDFEGCTMRELFRYADKNMYVDKNQAKIKEAADRRALHIQILDGIRQQGFQFSDCLYCDALQDQYTVLRASSNFFLAEDGSYSGAVEQIVQKLADDSSRKRMWERLQIPYIISSLSEKKEESAKYEIPYCRKKGEEILRGRMTFLRLDDTAAGELHHFIVGFEVFHDMERVLEDERLHLEQYYEQMKQSILENSNYVEALLETAEALYTVNLTQDRLEQIFHHKKKEERIFDFQGELPCSYDAYCRKIRQYITEDTLETYKIIDTSKSLLDRFYAGEKQVTVEYQERNKDGKEIWIQKTVLMSQDTVYDSGKEREHTVVRGIIMFRNTSEFHEKDQKEKEQLQIAYEKADMESKTKTEFMNRMSHDLRTPINGILGMIQVIRKNWNNQDKLEDSVDKIEISTRHLVDLVNDVLDMSKIESGHLTVHEEPFDLEELMKEVAVLMQGQLEETGITHRKHRKNIQHTMLKGDALQIQRIMMNLFGNAVKYNKKNGTIDTYVTEISCDGKNVLYEFRIEDSGIGMSREYMEHELFQPFTQEKADARTQYKGTGLGMSIVKGLIDKMNGTISVRSTLGEGSEFTFRLTFCLAEEGTQQAADNIEDGKDDLAEMRVLLVEDNDINMEIAEFYLTDAGIIVEKAWNGKEAVEKYEGTPKGYYSAILMDIMMPVMNGIEAARNIRRKEKNGGKEIPIIAMTAQSERESKESCSLAGMNAYISKPVDPENLIRILRMYQKR